MQQLTANGVNWCTYASSVEELSALSPGTASVLPRGFHDDDDAASTRGARGRTCASKTGGDAKWLRRK